MREIHERYGEHIRQADTDDIAEQEVRFLSGQDRRTGDLRLCRFTAETEGCTWGRKNSLALKMMDGHRTFDGMN